MQFNSQRIVGVSYKNLLQETVQKENSLLTVYETSIYGPSHLPTFSSIVHEYKIWTPEPILPLTISEQDQGLTHIILVVLKSMMACPFGWIYEIG